MEYRTLGRTGLRVSVMGIGTGGPSNFGQSTGVPEEESARLVRRALDLGINFFDTSAAYRESESILGRALDGVNRGEYILATKFQPRVDGQLVDQAAMSESVERSLERLRVDDIDIVQIHGLGPEHYRETVDRLMPGLIHLRDEGKIRYIGVSESYARDPRHEMLPQALADSCFDTVMVGYSLLSPTPEHVVLPTCQEKNIGVICMVAVRKALSRPEVLEANLRDARARGLIAADVLPERDPLGWLVRGEVASLPAAGYKFAAAHPAIGTVLSGTANAAHLEANVEAILGPRLPEEDMGRLRAIFGEVWEPLGN